MLLAIDTATHAIGLALHDGIQVLAESYWASGRYHTVELAPTVAMMLKRAGAEPAHLQAAAVTLGPGSYTGLRIGVAFAKGIALSHRLPLVGVPTFEVLAQAQPRRKEPLFAAIRAGRGRIAGMWYKWGRSGWKAQAEAVNLTWSDFIEQLNEKVYISGDIDGEWREVLARREDVTLASPAFCVRRPSVLAEIAWERLRRGRLPEARSLAPIYLEREGHDAG
jgi:tRNA threonylcarbamoyladenosine biosynthesis protein TsaB